MLFNFEFDNNKFWYFSIFIPGIDYILEQFFNRLFGSHSRWKWEWEKIAPRFFFFFWEEASKGIVLCCLKRIIENFIIFSHIFFFSRSQRDSKHVNGVNFYAFIASFKIISQCETYLLKFRMRKKIWQRYVSHFTPHYSIEFATIQNDYG